jgi:uncharacterized Zn-binding protein involved in type VI secretion
MSKLSFLITSVLISSVVFGQNRVVRSHETHPMPHSPGAHGASSSGMHTHSQVTIPTGQAVPTVTLNAQPDAKSGWNLNVGVTNFKFAPERVNQTSTTTEGHAHLYVNGKKVARLYGNWYHLESLPLGKNTVIVTLNTNKHEDLIYQGKPIQASTEITVSPARSKKQ